jgi:Tfp pilus assembly protein PilN
MDMIEINLLPKEFRKKSGGLQLGKAGYYGIIALVGVVAMVALITVYQIYQLKELDDKIAVARYRTQQLQKDIAVVDALIEVKGKIMQRMEAVDNLDRYRTVWVRILEDVNRRVPEFTWLRRFAELDKRQSSQPTNDTTAVPEDPSRRPYEIEGYSFTLNAIANLMINVMRSNYFSEIEMTKVEEVELGEQKAYNYKLTATLHYLSDEEMKKLLENESGPDLLASF